MSAGFFYLSMVDVSRPEGDRFVGATIVNAEDALGAIETARERGLVPKGAQVALVELHTKDDANRRITSLDMLPTEVAQMLWGRIATKAEIEAVDGGRPLTKQDLDAFICEDHANPP